jgi:hypothetical protein
MLEAIKFRLLPSQTGPLDERTGADGIGFTTAVNEDAAPVQPLTVALTE